MSEADSIINGMVEVLPIGDTGFSKIVETLTRIGVPGTNSNTLSQTAHILHRKGRYYIAHFKEMMMLDGLDTNITESDYARRNRIAQMLSDWGLCSIVDQKQLEPMGNKNIVNVIKYADKDKWTLVPKYKIGVRHEQHYNSR